MSVVDLETRLAVLQAEYDSLKADSAALIAAHPEFNGVSYEEFARRIATLAPGTIVRLTLGQFQQIANATFIVTTGNLVRARSLMAIGDAARARIDKLLTAGKNTLHAFRNLLDGIERANASADQVRRAVGLSGLGLAPGAIIALILAGGAVIVVGSVLIYTALATQQASLVASQEADRMCAADAAAGSPCTGARREHYREAVRRQETESGLVPAFRDFLRDAGSTVFWGGMLAVVGVLAYGAWVSAPAARLTRDRLRERASR